MATSLEETLVSVWRQALAENAKSVTLAGRTFHVRRTSRSRLREVDFEVEGHQLRGLEQNPETASRWAQLGTPRKEGHAVSAATEIHCCCGRWQGTVLRQANSLE